MYCMYICFDGIGISWSWVCERLVDQAIATEASRQNLCGKRVRRKTRMSLCARRHRVLLLVYMYAIRWLCSHDRAVSFTLSSRRKSLCTVEKTRKKKMDDRTASGLLQEIYRDAVAMVAFTFPRLRTLFALDSTQQDRLLFNPLWSWRDLIYLRLYATMCNVYPYHTAPSYFLTPYLLPRCVLHHNSLYFIFIFFFYLFRVR